MNARLFIIYFTMLLGLAPLFAQEVTVQLDRDRVETGNGALLTLKVSGPQAERPEIPAVDNLIVQPRGESREFQMFNGNTSSATIYTFVVGSNTPGDYVIPSIQVTIGGQKFSTKPLKLKVLGSPVGPQPPKAQGGPATPQPGAQQPDQQPAEDESKRFGFLTVELADSDRKHVYVGEIAPVRIRAWLPVDSQARLRSGVQPEGKAFTIHNVSDRPQETQEIRDGKRYTVVTWFGGISATKAGSNPVSLSLDATVAVRDPTAAPQRRRGGGPFDDPFFDRMFDTTPMIQKDVTLKSDDEEIEVRALPTEGRPAGFAGAVGKFQFDSNNIPGSWKTGEPQQISAKVSGSGNFALLNAPELMPPGDWKVYQGKSDFTPGDLASFAGSKSFQFNAVPRKGGEREVSLGFSYFDPEEAAYHTLTTPVKKIAVDGADLAQDKVAAAPPVVPPPVKTGSALAGQHSVRVPAATLVPLVSRPAFGQLVGAGGAMCLLGLAARGFRVRREDPKRRALAENEKAVRHAMDAANKAAAANDVPGFFAAGRQALQQRLSLLWNQAPLAITSAEVEARVPRDSPVARFFAEADRLEYSHQTSSASLPQWRQLLEESLASLKPLSK